MLVDVVVMTEQFSVQDINAPDGRLGDRYHAWQEPDELAERFIRHGSVEGALVLDPFAGTGSFFLAAARLGREARGCDNNPEMVKIVVERGCYAGRASSTEDTGPRLKLVPPTVAAGNGGAAGWR